MSLDRGSGRRKRPSGALAKPECPCPHGSPWRDPHAPFSAWTRGAAPALLVQGEWWCVLGGHGRRGLELGAVMGLHGFGPPRRLPTPPQTLGLELCPVRHSLQLSWAPGGGSGPSADPEAWESPGTLEHGVSDALCTYGWGY